MAAASAPVVLIDMDNTLVNFDAEFSRRWLAARPADSTDIVTNRKHFELEENFPPETRDLALKIMGTPGFYRSFEPIDGALAAVREMVDSGLAVYFCTAPHPLQYETCVAEKYEWVRRHLGEDYLPRLVITRDKTLVRGAVLIDDKPRVKGSCDDPEWTHIIFDQPYTRDIPTDDNPHPRLTSWPNWRAVLQPFLPKHP